MNDRFKFRVWSEEYKMYVEDNCYPIGGDYSLSMTQNGYVEVIGMGDYNDDDSFSWGTIDSLKDSAGDCIVEHCTGLKDKNGKLIYENDLIKIDGVVAVIKWSDYYARFMLESQEYNFDFETTYAEECEVIGNIHKNLELLEVNND